MKASTIMSRKLSYNDYADYVLANDLITLVKYKVGKDDMFGTYHFEMREETYNKFSRNACLQARFMPNRLYDYEIIFDENCEEDKVYFVFESNVLWFSPRRKNMREGDIQFVNVVVDLIKCYCKDNGADKQIIFDAISTAFNKESNDGNNNQTGNNESKSILGF